MRVVLTGRLEKSRQPNSRAIIGLNGNGAGKIRPTTNSGVGYKNVGRSSSTFTSAILMVLAYVALAYM